MGGAGPSLVDPYHIASMHRDPSMEDKRTTEVPAFPKTRHSPVQIWRVPVGDPTKPGDKFQRLNGKDCAVQYHSHKKYLR